MLGLLVLIRFLRYFLPCTSKISPFYSKVLVRDLFMSFRLFIYGLFLLYLVLTYIQHVIKFSVYIIGILKAA